RALAQAVDVAAAGTLPHHRGQGHGGDHGAAVGFEDIRAHAGDVANVVADVVGNHARVARVVLGNAGLDLADQVGANVSRLGEDAATDAIEQRDHAGAHAEAVDVVRGLRVVGKNEVERAQAEQAQRGDEHAHHRAAVEGDTQGRANAF